MPYRNALSKCRIPELVFVAVNKCKPFDTPTEIYSEPCCIKSNLDCNHTLSIVITIGSCKIDRRRGIKIQIRFNLAKIRSRLLVMAYQNICILVTLPAKKR